MELMLCLNSFYSRNRPFKLHHWESNVAIQPDFYEVSEKRTGVVQFPRELSWAVPLLQNYIRDQM